MPVTYFLKTVYTYRWWLFVVVAVSTLVLWWTFPVATAEVTPIEDSSPLNNTYTLQNTKLLPVPASGVVEATNHTVVRAKTAGEITDIFAREGAVVVAGQLLARLDTPVVDSTYALSLAQADFSRIQSEATVSSKNTVATNQSVVAFSAHDIALLRETGNQSGVEESSKQLATTLEAAVLNLSATADFVDQNRYLFSKSGMETYRQLVTDLYGRQPNYLTGSILYGVTNSENLLKRLKENKASSQYNAEEMQALAVLVDGQLNALTELLATGERTVFDKQAVDSADAVYTEYLVKREAALTAQTSVQSAIAGLRSTITATSEDALNQGKSVVITEADAKEAKRQADFAVVLAGANAMVSNASLGVVSAQIGLGQARAPFSGTVSKVEANVGEYVQPGSPILTLVGTAGKELTVTVPATFVNHLEVGQEFVRNDKVIGYVSRFSTMAERGSVQVVIEVVSDEVAIGDSITGDILLSEGATDVVSLPRGYVHFTSTGAVVITDSDKRIPVTIAYDYGETVFVRGDLTSGMNVRSTISGTF